jgi:hypothetical protein
MGYEYLTFARIIGDAVRRASYVLRRHHSLASSERVRGERKDQKRQQGERGRNLAIAVYFQEPYSPRSIGVSS